MLADDDRPIEDHELPDPADMDDGDGVDVEPCPSCGEDIAAGAAQCPYCRAWTVGRPTPLKARLAAAIVAVAVVAIIVALLYGVLT